MNIVKIRQLVESAVADGLLVRSEGTMLSSSEGYNHTGRAVLGVLLDNVGQPTFNAYCKNQKSITGWLSSKNNPVCQMARNLLKAVGHDDPTSRSMLTDVERELIRPLIDEHTRLGGRRPSNAEIDAASAMLAAKIMLDLSHGNGDLAKSIPMLAASDTAADSPETCSEEQSGPLDEVVSLSAENLVGVAVGFSKALLGDNASNHEAGGDVFIEVLALYVHAADRIAFEKLGSQRARSFTVALLVAVAEAGEAIFPEERRAGIMGEIIATIRRRMKEYGQCEELISSSALPENQEKVVLGKFFKNLEPFGIQRTMNPWQIGLRKVQFYNGLNVMNLGELLEEALAQE